MEQFLLNHSELLCLCCGSEHLRGTDLRGAGSGYSGVDILVELPAGPCAPNGGVKEPIVAHFAAPLEANKVGPGGREAKARLVVDVKFGLSAATSHCLCLTGSVRTEVGGVDELDTHALANV